MSWWNRSISLFRVTIARRCLLSYKIHKKLFRLEFYFSGKKVNFIVVLASPCFFAFTFIGYISNLKENNFLWEENYARFCGFKLCKFPRRFWETVDHEIKFPQNSVLKISLKTIKSPRGKREISFKRRQILKLNSAKTSRKKYYLMQN